jgi:Uma2 family endonuclease
LEPADPETPLQTTFHFQTEEEDEFEVEKILEQRGQRYLVKWKGYPHSENTWEPKNNLKNNLRNCQKLPQQFQQNSTFQKSEDKSKPPSIAFQVSGPSVKPGVLAENSSNASSRRR